MGMVEIPEPIYTQRFTSFDFDFGGENVARIEEGVKLLASEQTYWLGSTEFRNQKMAVMAQRFSLDDEALKGTSVLTEFLPPLIDSSGGQIVDEALYAKAMPLVIDGLPPIVNDVYVPALLMKLDKKCHDEGNPAGLRAAIEELQAKVIQGHLY